MAAHVCAFCGYRFAEPVDRPSRPSVLRKYGWFVFAALIVLAVIVGAIVNYVRSRPPEFDTPADMAAALDEELINSDCQEQVRKVTVTGPRGYCSTPYGDPIAHFRGAKSTEVQASDRLHHSGSRGT